MEVASPAAAAATPVAGRSAMGILAVVMAARMVAAAAGSKVAMEVCVAGATMAEEALWEVMETVEGRAGV